MSEAVEVVDAVEEPAPTGNARLDALEARLRGVEASTDYIQGATFLTQRALTQLAVQVRTIDSMNAILFALLGVSLYVLARRTGALEKLTIALASALEAGKDAVH